eukprot:Em0009g848a
MTTMKTIASLLLVIGLCVLSNGMPNAIKEVAERDIAKDVSNLVSSLGQTEPVTGPPKTELMQAGKNDDLPIGARIQEELHTVDDAMRDETKIKLVHALASQAETTGAMRTMTMTMNQLVHALATTTTDARVVPIGTAKTPTQEDAGTVRRKDGSVDFYRNWDQYVKGFGDLNGEFWLGLRQINEITAHSSSTLRVDLPSGYYAKYSSFSVGDSASNYTLSVSGYSGNAGYDSLSYHNGMKFTTLDKDNDNWGGANCASQYKGAFWYNNCYYVNSNGEYNSYLYWYPLGNIKFDEMKIRRN